MQVSLITISAIDKFLKIGCTENKYVPKKTKMFMKYGLSSLKEGRYAKFNAKYSNITRPMSPVLGMKF